MGYLNISEFRAKAARIHKAEYQRKELKRALEFHRGFSSNLLLSNDRHARVRCLRTGKELHENIKQTMPKPHTGLRTVCVFTIL